MMKRRHLLAAFGYFPVLAVANMLPRFAVASVEMGDMTLTSVSDGALTLPENMDAANVPQDELARIRAEFGLSGDTVTRPCNVTLLQSPGRTVLFDVGAGQEFMPTTGDLLAELDALGVAPEDVTDIVFTHGHPDHLWGLLDDFGDPAFTEAAYHMGQREFGYWMDPRTVDLIDGSRTVFAVGAKRRLEMIADQVMLFRDGEEILPGVAARATFGHTPGHMAFEVRAGTEAMMIIGDSVTNHHVGFVRPDWPSGGDQDKDVAAVTRVKLLDQLAREQTRILGFHLPGNGIGRVERKDGAYQFVAEDA